MAFLFKARTTILASLVLSATQVVGVPAPIPLQESGRYRFDTWKLEQGLPQISIFAITQDSRGYIWLGTEEGLVRFDGQTFTTFDRSTTPELQSHFIQTLLAGPDGSLWIGTHNGLGHRQDGRMAFYSTEDGLVHQEIYALYRDRRSHLWIGTVGGLSRFDGERFVSFTAADGLPDDSVYAIGEDSEGGLWIGTEKGLARVEPRDVEGPSVSFISEQSLSGLAIHALEMDRQGRLWVGTSAGLYAIEHGKVAAYSVKTGLPHPSVRSLQVTDDDSLWIGTERGLSRLGSGSAEDRNFESYTSQDGLSDDWVESFWQDHEGSVWVGTRFGGLNRLRDFSVRTLGPPEGLVHELVWGVNQDRAGHVWVATNQGLSQIRPDGTVLSFGVEDGLPDPATGAIYEDLKGRLWIGTFEHGLVRFESGRLRVFNAEDGFPAVRVRRVLEDSDGRIFIATHRGLFEYTESGFESWSVDDGLPHEHIRDAHADPDGGLWLATDGGLARFKNGAFSSYASDQDPLTEERIKSIYGDADGVLWLGTWERGLARFKNGEHRFISMADGLHHRRIHRILEDDGWLWMSSNQGIFRVRKSELDDFFEGRIGSVTSIVYGENEGLRSRECNGGAQPAGIRTQDGRLWFATIAGVAVIDPQNLRFNHVPPPVHIESMEVDRQPIMLETDRISQPIEFPSHSREFAFHSVALSFLAPESNRFKYRLEGFDEDWIDATDRRSAYYTNLAPGSYRFRVIASNNDGVWNGAGDSVEIYLRPAFYQTWYFILGAWLASAVAVWSLYRGRVRHMVRQETERHRIELLEAKNVEMGAFTRTVAHDLKTPLFTIEGFLGFLERDLARAKMGVIPSHIKRIRTASQQMGRLLDALLELSHGGRIVDEPQEVAMQELALEAIEIAAAQIAEKRVEVIVAPNLPRVEGDANRLLQVFQNLITNAVKFIGPGQPFPQIEIGVRDDSSKAGEPTKVFFVQDNGIGIDRADHQKIFGLFDKLSSQAAGSGVGLALVQQIVDAHGGRVWVESEGSGRGSTFCFTVAELESTKKGSNRSLEGGATQVSRHPV